MIRILIYLLTVPVVPVIMGNTGMTCEIKEIIPKTVCQVCCDKGVVKVCKPTKCPKEDKKEN